VQILAESARFSKPDGWPCWIVQHLKVRSSSIYEATHSAAWRSFKLSSLHSSTGLHAIPANRLPLPAAGDAIPCSYTPCARASEHTCQWPLSSSTHPPAVAAPPDLVPRCPPPPLPPPPAQRGRWGETGAAGAAAAPPPAPPHHHHRAAPRATG
jgi:hypothetical protein